MSVEVDQIADSRTVKEGAGVTAVVVDYRSGQQLLGAVNSILDGGAEKVIVVDNTPEGATDSVLTGEDPRVSVVHAGRNLGYGAAVNLVLPSIDTRFVLISNPDIVVEPGVIEKLVHLLSDRRVGVVGPKILNPDGSTYPSFRNFPTLLESIGHGLLGMIAPGNRFSVRYRMTDARPISPTVVPWISGAFLMAPTAFLKSIGGFDSSYFMYCEDMDLCFRAEARGYQVVYDPTVSVTHRQGHSSRQRAVRSLYQHHRSMWIFATTHEKSIFAQWLGFFGLASRFGVLASVSLVKGYMNNARGNDDSN